MTDDAPEAQSARASLEKETLAELSGVRPLTAHECIAADVMRERLQIAVDQYEAGERLRDLRIIGSPYQSIRQCFDLMATSTHQDWEIIATRMEAVPGALRSFEAALREGAGRGVVAARDAVGSERYQLWARAFLGSAIDLTEAYQWGWEELHRIEERMALVAERILPGESLAAVVHRLETDPARSIDGVETFRRWLQDLMDRTIAELDGTHF